MYVCMHACMYVHTICNEMSATSVESRVAGTQAITVMTVLISQPFSAFGNFLNKKLG